MEFVQWEILIENEQSKISKLYKFESDLNKWNRAIIPLVKSVFYRSLKALDQNGNLINPIERFIFSTKENGLSKCSRDNRQFIMVYGSTSPIVRWYWVLLLKMIPDEMFTC